jgi:prepilin-type N-terminal cleavage/methylation domain-containing protein
MAAAAGSFYRKFSSAWARSLTAALALIPPQMHKSRAAEGFTLVELLTVMAIMVVLLGLITPTLKSYKGSQDVTASAYNLRGVLENARNYAMANNTYVWVGFYEQDYSNTTPPATAQAPPYTGVGHVTIGVVYSKDGTNLVPDSTAGSVTLPAASLGQVGSLVQIYAVHVTALNPPAAATANSTDPTIAGTLQGRPYQTDLDAASLEQTLINSSSPDTTLRPFVALGYTFYKTIRFNPRGESNVNSTDPCTRIAEVGLQPTHGDIKDSTTPNLVAVQLAGIGGAVNIYRQ